MKPVRSPAPGSPLARLYDGPMRPGTVVWIGVRPARRAAMRALAATALVEARGFAEDHARAGGARQVTLIARESLLAVAGYLGRDEVAPDLLRRNLVVAGINLHALKDRRFTVGAALLEWSGECHPCSRMEEALGPGGYNALRSHGGITARVLRGGAVRIGDPVERAPTDVPAT